MDAIISHIIKEQNRLLLTQLAEKTGKPVDMMLQKYWTPTFYYIGSDPTYVHPIVVKEHAKKKSYTKYRNTWKEEWPSPKSQAAT